LVDVIVDEVNDFVSVALNVTGEGGGELEEMGMLGTNRHRQRRGEATHGVKELLVVSRHDGQLKRSCNGG
jgi:hypothetical protein